MDILKHIEVSKAVLVSVSPVGICRFRISSVIKEMRLQQKFLSFINEVDGMHHLVKKPREQVSDAEALQDLANTLVTYITVHSTGCVTPSVFISSLITQYGEKGRIGMTKKVQISWKDIGLHVSPIFMICWDSCTMLGADQYQKLKHS